MIKLILFDFYGVFLPDTFSEWLRANGLIREGVFADLIAKLDKAEINETTFLDELSTQLGRIVTANELVDQTGQLDDAIVTLARELKRDYTVCLLSNASIKLRIKLKNLGIDTLFDTIIISSEVGCAKPDDSIFQKAINQLGVDASEILFIDDNPLNTSAASRNGITSITYTSSQALQEALQSHGAVHE